MNLLFGLFISVFLTSSIYTYSIDTNNAPSISMAAFQGKKVLFVNTASGSTRSSQVSKLKQLQQMHADSLVVIILPSNSFGNEPMNDFQLQSQYASLLNNAFVLAKKGEVIGANRVAIYNWLTKKSENGAFSNEVGGDFFKYLVGSNGQLLGVFSSDVDPLSEELTSSL
jgi:glutathione peroxidase